MSETRSPHQSRPQHLRRATIHAQLLQGKFPNCATLSKLLDVSAKTVAREIEFMKDTERRPIEYDQAQRGYYYTEEVTNFPDVVITEGEFFALLIAQRALEQYRGTPLEKKLSRSFAKITAQLKDEITFDVQEAFEGISFRSTGAVSTSIKVFEVLATGLRKKKKVAIGHLKAGQSVPTERKVNPYHLACIQSVWYLVAYDSKSRDVRTFALSRIKTAVATKEAFVRPEDFSAEKFFSDSFGVFTGSGVIDVEIEFESFASALVQERDWHQSQSFATLPNGKLRMTLKVSRLEEIKNWILGWGRNAKVVAPASLAAEIRVEAEAIARQYAGA
jgi:predicted DNA-binding transcriptional regulator YafY